MAADVAVLTAKFTVPPLSVVSAPKLPHDVMPDPIVSALEVHVPVAAREFNVALSRKGSPVLADVVDADHIYRMYLLNEDVGAVPVVQVTAVSQVLPSEDACVCVTIEFPFAVQSAVEESHGELENVVSKDLDVNTDDEFAVLKSSKLKIPVPESNFA